LPVPSKNCTAPLEAAQALLSPAISPKASVVGAAALGISKEVFPPRSMVAGREMVGFPEQSPFATLTSLEVPVTVRADTTPVVVAEPRQPVARAPRACSALREPLAVWVM
jgi:hypothetical protein